jgi:glucan phosphoethanolaminetransferase (alkaline phosphatase superfamily)
VLIGSLFLHWAQIPYQSDTPGIINKFGLSGWDSLETGDAVFLFIAIFVFGMVVTKRLEGPWLLLLALASLAVVTAFLISTTPIAESYGVNVNAEPSRGVGAWVALGGTALLLIAGIVQAKGWLQNAS